MHKCCDVIADIETWHAHGVLMWCSDESGGVFNEDIWSEGHSVVPDIEQNIHEEERRETAD